MSVAPALLHAHNFVASAGIPPPLELLCTDSDVAALLRMSNSWVRKQRMLRRRGQPHVLTVDPIMIASCPRYRFTEIATWLAQQVETVNQ